MENQETYSVILSKPEGCERNILTQILQEYSHLAHGDVVMSVRHSWGFIAEKITKDEASALENICNKNGVSVFIAPGTSIAKLPSSEACTRLDCLPQGLKFTVKNTTEEISWQNAAMVCAGPIPEEKVTLKKVNEGPSNLEKVAKRVITAFTLIPIPTGRSKESIKKTVETEIVNYLEIFITNPLRRLKMKSSELDYAYMGGRRDYSSMNNYRMLLEDLGKFTVKSLKNRGFQAILNKETLSLVGYDSYSYFEKELRWLLTLFNLRNI